MDTSPPPARLDDLEALSASVMADCEQEFAGLDIDQTRSVVEAALDALIGMAVLMPPPRWEEDCHRCEERIGDHAIDGRCPG
jgi:hypothetical protein